MKVIKFILGLICVYVLFNFFCNKGPEGKCIGTWRNNNITLVVNSDHTCKLNNDDCSWTFKETDSFFHRYQMTVKRLTVNGESIENEILKTKKSLDTLKSMPDYPGSNDKSQLQLKWERELSALEGGTVFDVNDNDVSAFDAFGYVDGMYLKKVGSEPPTQPSPSSESKRGV